MRKLIFFHWLIHWYKYCTFNNNIVQYTCMYYTVVAYLPFDIAQITTSFTTTTYTGNTLHTYSYEFISFITCLRLHIQSYNLTWHSNILNLMPYINFTHNMRKADPNKKIIKKMAILKYWTLSSAHSASSSEWMHFGFRPLFQTKNFIFKVNPRLSAS